MPWLEPFPTAPPDRDDPAAVAERRADTRLALVAALQRLPPRQRVVLILRDVLDWRAAEAAEVLDTTTAAVNGLLLRARARFTQSGPGREDRAEPLDARHRALLDRYATAFENADIAELERVLREDAVWEMPPFPVWFTGRSRITRFLAPRLPRPGTGRMIPVEANGQPAFALYVADEHGVHHAHAIHVLTVDGTRVAHVVAFLDPAMFALFGLPRGYGVDEPAPD